MRKKTILGIVVTIAIIGGLTTYLVLASGSTAASSFRMEKVQKGDIAVVVTATGTLSAVTTVQVGTQVSGIISKLYVDFNDHVKKNQVIAQIDPTFLQASVLDAQATLQRAKAQADNSARIFERTKILKDKDLAAQADYDAALAAKESDAAAEKSAEAGLERADINLHYATIRAPIDGVVISRQVDVGQTVAASLAAPTIFTIANDLTKMQVQADVDEADIGHVQVGQGVTFTVDAYPDQQFTGTVRQIRLNPQTVQNVVNYTVIIDVPNPDLKLMPGMTATVTIMVTKKDDVLKIPTIALRFTPPTDLVAARKDSTQASSDTASVARRRRFMQQMSQFGGDRDRMQAFAASKGFARLWRLGPDKKLQPVFVRTGISDGTYTEIMSDKVHDGDTFVVGVLAARGAGPASSPMGGGRMRF